MVVDASILLLGITKPAGQAARLLALASSLESPELFVLEVANSLRSSVIRREVSLDQSIRGLARLQRLPIVRHPLMPLLDRVWELRENLTAYDAAYVALAERLGVSLLTADTGIARAPKIRCKVNLVKLEALS